MDSESLWLEGFQRVSCGQIQDLVGHEPSTDRAERVARVSGDGDEQSGHCRQLAEHGQEIHERIDAGPRPEQPETAEPRHPASPADQEKARRLFADNIRKANQAVAGLPSNRALLRQFASDALTLSDAG